MLALYTLIKDRLEATGKEGLYMKKTTYCLDCGTSILNVSIRCHKCANKILGRSRRGRDKERERKRIALWIEENRKQWMHKIKEKFGDYCCSYCGYSKCEAAIEFHHIDPKKKEFNIGSLVKRRKPIPELIEELNKGILLCSNCHREFHYGGIRC